MIYFFTWNSDYLIREQVKAWKDKFVTKFWDFNLLHIKSIESVNNNFLVENITSTSFLAEKKLIIIDLEEKLSDDKQNFLLKILDKIPEENIVLFSSINPDKRNKLYKELKKNSEHKEYNNKDEQDIKLILSKKYWNKITPSWINTIIAYKSWNLNKIVSEIEKLSILFNKIDSKEIIDNIVPELEESIFQVIDDILNKKIISSISKIDLILNDTSVYAFYNNLLANLRTSLYIIKLKHIGKNTANIWKILNLWNRAFLINKRYSINYSEIEKLYINLVWLDKKMKSWKLNWTEEKDFRFELEKIILS